ncbi:MAG: protease complex subunit PrcB family protein [Blautia sp.]|nr:protease complex subunit PrcB family protein [Blautia sp.]
MGKRSFLSGICLLAVLTLGGCRFIRIEEEGRTPVDYTVVKQTELPDEVLEIIEEKKEEDFRLTCQNGKDLYLIRGYGLQMSGGYSIRVEELSRTSNAMFFHTKLLGPQTAVPSGEPSYPYIVVKTVFEDLPVEFE